MSEHKTGKSNLTPEQKEQYRAMRAAGGKPFQFKMRGFTYQNGKLPDHLKDVIKPKVSAKALRKNTKRARKFIPYMSKDGAGK